ncbi:UDP-glucose 4-epimerase GalE [Desulfoscipio gibsoniae]|uniref:UDP-glucose 4-epimerase n=1 Tax=Desulfoscipio gibsoniae DSM 7213 TaxID=767817 RepID=R4KQ70_9FIRM|nr:UDP-glucose 4-epimerase GalE [Desulfoscipio gibsoniae]AGL02725.1 UDP-glucose-4-epimerase [Desulfoscipio gibsoniae DSM 7213]
MSGSSRPWNMVRINQVDMKNILVTGGAGYIGSHVVQELLKRDYTVVTLDNLSKGHRGAVVGGVFVQGDCGNSMLVGELVKQHQINAVVHLAADSLVGESMTRPDKYCRNNLGNGIEFLTALVDAGVRQFILSSTAAVYGEPEYTPIDEAHPTRPVNVYGGTKLMLEQILGWYEHAYGLRFVALRYFNAAGADPGGNIGEDHNPETHLIPLVMQAALGKREKVTILGTNYPTPDGTCLRDYIHVSDLAVAHVLALEALQAGEPSAVYNLGNEQGHSVREVVDTVRRVTGRDFTVEEGPPREGDPAVLVASSRKIKDCLKWQPRYGELEEIVRTAWAWHSNHPDGYQS